MTIKRTIHASIDLVFKTVSDINNFSKAVPHIVSAEILSDTKSGVGTRFRETRLMNGKEATTVLDVTESSRMIAFAWSPIVTERFGIPYSPSSRMAEAPLSN